MIKHKISVAINRPAEEVFAFMNDPETAPQWITAISERKQTSAGPMGVGTTFRDRGQLLGRKIENTYEITEYKPDRVFRLKTVSGSIPVDATLTYEPVGGGTRVTQVIEAEAAGFFKLAEPIVARIIKRQFETDFANLKELLEAEA